MRLLREGSRWSCLLVFVSALLIFPISSAAQSRITDLSDFNGDGKTDLLWYNPATGQSAGWLMDGTYALSNFYLPSNPYWKITATADFNGDGIADLLWYNPSNGQVIQWLMNGISVSRTTVILSDPNWKIVEAADFNGDGKSDLLLFNASAGQTVAWLMNGSSVASTSLLLTNPTWKVDSTADFNGDGKADLLWGDTATGQSAVWLMNGGTTLSGAMLGTDANWKVSATADFNGDHMSDVVWYNGATGGTAVWMMNGTMATAYSVLLTDPSWRVSATGDFNGDGNADLLWNNSTTGQTSAWLMNGTNVLSSSSLLIDLNWKINATADLDDDGKSDLLWYNAATGQTASWLMNGSAATGGANLLTNSTWRLACIKISSLTAMLACNDSTTNASVGNASLPPNQAPLVNAGPDLTVALTAYANISGLATDDGIPIRLLSSSWSQLSGPGPVSFGNVSSTTTTAAFSLAGTYTLRLTATDSALSTSDNVVITVNPNGTVNTAPVVNAGPDQTITMPASASLAGSATDDALPTGSSLSRTWTKVSGPGTVSFGNASSAVTTAAFSLAGTYTLRLTATDTALSTSDNVVFVVNSCGNVVSGAIAVVANASDNVGITSVQMNLNGVKYGNSITTAPYSFPWNTTTVPNGCQLVSVIAQDAAGNQGTSSVWTLVSNP
jgi:hypothetical protein